MLHNTTHTKLWSTCKCRSTGLIKREEDEDTTEARSVFHCLPVFALWGTRTVSNPTLAASILSFPKQYLSYYKNPTEGISPGHCAVWRNISDSSPYSCQRLDAASQQDPSLSQTHRRYTHNSSSELLGRNYSVIVCFLNPDKWKICERLTSLMEGVATTKQLLQLINSVCKANRSNSKPCTTYFKKFLLFKTFDMWEFSYSQCYNTHEKAVFQKTGLKIKWWNAQNVCNIMLHKSLMFSPSSIQKVVQLQCLNPYQYVL